MTLRPRPSHFCGPGCLLAGRRGPEADEEDAVAQARLQLHGTHDAVIRAMNF